MERATLATHLFLVALPALFLAGALLAYWKGRTREP